MSRARAFAAAAALSALTALGGCNASDLNLSDSDVQILDDEPGQGPAARSGDEVCIDFDVIVPDGTVKTRNPKGKRVLEGDDFCFKVGAGAVIEGIDDAVVGMRKGGQRTILCPPHKHWGRRGYGKGKIPPNTALVFHVTMQSVER